MIRKAGVIGIVPRHKTNTPKNKNCMHVHVHVHNVANKKERKLQWRLEEKGGRKYFPVS